MSNPSINPATSVSLEHSTVADVPRCDVCGAPAVFAFAFPWEGEGSRGNVCATHAMVKQQTAENLGRSCIVTALAPSPNAPLSRDERTKLKAETYALEAEAEDLKARGLALFRENERLTTQLQALHVRHEETSAQLRDARAELAQLRQQLEERDSEHGDLVDEVQRLRTLAKVLPSERGIEGTIG